jgi:hypothetical protein
MHADGAAAGHILVGQFCRQPPGGLGARLRRQRLDLGPYGVQRPGQIDGRRPGPEQRVIGPEAPATPISGAPRTTIVRIPSAASGIVRQLCTLNTCGSLVWSITATEQPSSAGQIVR